MKPMTNSGTKNNLDLNEKIKYLSTASQFSQSPSSKLAKHLDSSEMLFMPMLRRRLCAHI